MRECAEGFHAHRLAQSEFADNGAVAFHISIHHLRQTSLPWSLLAIAGGLVDLLDQLGDHDFLDSTVNVHDGGVAGGENTAVLQQVQDIDLAFEFLDGVDVEVFVANDISIHHHSTPSLPSEDIHIGNALQLDVDVLAGLGGKDFLLVDGDGGDFGLTAVGHEQDGVAHDLQVIHSYSAIKLYENCMKIV